MKNKQQIGAFLKATKTRELKDELAIESFLARQGIYVKFDETKKTENASHVITFEDFEKWFDEDVPEKGDVIVIGDTIGIIQEVNFSSFVLGVSIAKGILSLSQSEIPAGKFRNADKKEILELQRELNKKRVYWSKFHNKLSDNIEVFNNQQIRIGLLGEKFAIGVFREINDKGEIIMYCMKENNKPVRHSLYESVGKVSDYQLEPISNQDRNVLTDELEKVGKLWNGYYKRIEPINFRLKKGSTYYYIDDFWNIRETIDYYKPKDEKKMRCGNYFKSREEANRVLGVMVEERNKLLAVPEIAVKTGKKKK